MTVSVVDDLEFVEVAHQYGGVDGVAVQLLEELIEFPSIRQTGQRGFKGVTPYGTEQFGATDGDGYVGGNGLQQLHVVGAEASPVDAGDPQLAPYLVLVHHGHCQFALLVELPKQRKTGRVGVLVVDAVEVRPAVLEQ